MVKLNLALVLQSFQSLPNLQADAQDSHEHKTKKGGGVLEADLHCSAPP